MSKHPKLVSVGVRKGDINRALKIFKRRVNESGHLFELRERQQYTKALQLQEENKNRLQLENNKN